MVGRKTSPRCANCRQRKIKCDLSEPSCSQCLNSGWHCPGYDLHSRFFEYRKCIGKATSTSGSVDHADLHGKKLAKKRISCVHPVHTHPVSETDRLRTEFIFKFTQKSVAARFAVIPEQHVLMHLPQRLGESQALDNAVKCVCSTSNIPPSYVDDRRLSAAAYSDALHSLQRALDGGNGCPGSETLAAAVLLQMFEHSVDHAELRWVVHANGVIKMLELRGPSQIKNELDRSMLQAEVGNIFFKAIKDQTDCFLADPEWLPVLKLSMEEAHRGDDLSSDGFPEMVLAGLNLPGILCRFEGLLAWLINSLSSGEADFELLIDVDRSKLLTDLKQTHKRLASWREEYLASDDQSTTTQAPSISRAHHASRLSVSAFSIMTGLMLATVTFIIKVPSSNRPANYSSEPRLDDLITTNKQLVTTARNELRALKAVDAIAARQTTALLRIALNRVLVASRHGEVDLNGLWSLSEDLAELLKGDS